MYQHPLQRRIVALRSQMLRLMTIRGLSTTATVAIATLIAFGSIDYCIRFQDRGVLAIFTVLLATVSAWTTYKYLYLPRTARLGDCDLALHVESCFPAVKDRLASALEFLKQSEEDATAGSAALRRTVIAQTVAEADRLDFTSVLDPRPTLLATLAVLVVGLVAAGLVALNPTAARLALTRLAVPFGRAVWPQATHLELRQPVASIARGQPFDIEIVDAEGAGLPSNCRIHYRLVSAEGKTTEDVEPMQRLGDSAIARRENLTRSFEFRVVGGDDLSMPWKRVEVLDPPAVRNLELARTPPTYANLPSETCDAAASGPMLAGTRVRFQGEATKPLRKATLRLEGGREIAAQVSEDGLHFSVGDDAATGPHGLLVQQSASYGFQLLDRDGLNGGSESRWQLHVLPDAAPTITLEQPSTNQFVAPRAVVNVKVRARDDLALRQLALVYRASNGAAASENILTLYDGPPQPARTPNLTNAASDTGDQRAIDFRWDLEELKLSPGTQWTIYATATDYRPQVGRSDRRILSVISPEELQDRLLMRQALILSELTRLLQVERDAHSQVSTLQIRVNETVGLQQADVDKLQGIEFNQREVARGLTSRGDGVPMQVLSLLSDIENNRLDNPDFHRRLESILAEVERLEQKHLPQAGNELTAAVKSTQVRLQSDANPPKHDEDTQSSLGRACEHQLAIIAVVESMLAELRRWDDYRRFHRDVAQLLRDQEELARNAAELGRRTLTRDVKELSPQESADVKVLAARQLEAARRLDRIEQEMEQAATALQQTEPLAVATLADALAESRRLAIAAEMRIAGSQIEQNQIGQVASGHLDILRNLQEVLDILTNNRRQEFSRTIEKLDAAGRDLDALRLRQQGLRNEIDKKADIKPLANEQKQLGDESGQLARRLQRLLAEEAGQVTEKAAEQMNRGAIAAAQGAAKEAGLHAKDAEDSLGDAAQRLRVRKFQLQSQLAMEQFARLEDTIKHLRRQEQKILDETRDFDALARAGELSREQVSGLRELTRQQELLHDEATRLAKSLDAASVFRVAISAVTTDMGRASAMLDRRQTGLPVQQAEQDVIARLALTLKAIEPEKPDPAAENTNSNNKPSDGKPSDGGAKKSSPSGAVPLAELKLLKLLQEDMNARTTQLQSAAAGAPPSDDLQHQFDRLAEEQRRLAELAMKLLAPEQPANPNDHK